MSEQPRTAMPITSLTTTAGEELAQARQAPARRASRTVYGGHEHALRQTVIALVGGTSLAEHSNPGEATVQVLAGRVRTTAGEDAVEAGPGDLMVVPDARHALEALEDAVVLLTVAKRV